jgi:hypothetical protein
VNGAQDPERLKVFLSASMKNILLHNHVLLLLYVQINRRTLRRDPLIKVLEDEDEGEGEDDLWTDAR